MILDGSYIFFYEKLSLKTWISFPQHKLRHPSNISEKEHVPGRLISQAVAAVISGFSFEFQIKALSLKKNIKVGMKLTKITLQEDILGTFLLCYYIVYTLSYGYGPYLKGSTRFITKILPK